MPVETQIEALLGKLGVEADESFGVVSCWGTQTQCASVAQDDVDIVLPDGAARLLFQAIDHQLADAS